jgi:hypothetical protein
MVKVLNSERLAARLYVVLESTDEYTLERASDLLPALFGGTPTSGTGLLEIGCFFLKPSNFRQKC